MNLELFIPYIPYVIAGLAVLALLLLLIPVITWIENHRLLRAKRLYWKAAKQNLDYQRKTGETSGLPIPTIHDDVG